MWDDDDIVIEDSARKHGIPDDDTKHAMRVPFRIIERENTRTGNTQTVVIGADRTGRLLELVYEIGDHGGPRVFHSMELRRSFYRFL